MIGLYALLVLVVGTEGVVEEKEEEEVED